MYRLRTLLLKTTFVFLAIVLAAFAASCGGDDEDDGQPGATASSEETPSPEEAPEALPTPPPGLTARFLDPAEVGRSDVPAEQYESYSRLVDEVTINVEEFWTGWFDEHGGGEWSGPEIIERDPGTPIECDGMDVSVLRGSFFCPADNYVTFEESRQLLPLYLQHGPYAVAMVISHEFGHAVQRSLGIRYVGSEEQELQADCFAGVWFKDYQADGAFSDPEEPFLQAYAAMRTVTNGRELIDRFDALAAGFLEGPEPCLELAPPGEPQPEATSSG